MAMQFSAGPTQGYAGAKRLQLAAFQGDLAASLRLEAAEMNRASKTADSLEAVRAFVENGRRSLSGADRYESHAASSW